MSEPIPIPQDAPANATQSFSSFSSLRSLLSSSYTEVNLPFSYEDDDDKMKELDRMEEIKDGEEKTSDKISNRMNNNVNKNAKFHIICDTIEPLQLAIPNSFLKQMQHFVRMKIGKAIFGLTDNELEYRFDDDKTDFASISSIKLSEIHIGNYGEMKEYFLFLKRNYVLYEKIMKWFADNSQTEPVEGFTSYLIFTILDTGECLFEDEVRADNLILYQSGYNVYSNCCYRYIISRVS